MRLSPEFQDVSGDVNGFGSLDGMGAKEHHQARTSMQPDGVVINLYCDTCGTPNAVKIEWGEFVYGLMRLAPPGWRYEPQYGGIHPNVGCARCRALLLFILTPDECRRHLNSGEQAGHVQRPQIEGMMAAVQQQMGAHRR